MGWNQLISPSSKSENILLKSMPHDEFFYFVHSYYSELNPYSTADCRYILPFSAMLQKDNFYAAQFHPEKSGKAGETLLTNFLSL
jgi:glutamine amidotransferase